MDPLVLALQLAARQHGIITRRQALEVGLTVDRIRGLLASGHWERVARGVFRIAGSRRTWEQRSLTFCLAAGPDAAVSHLAGAHLYGCNGFGPVGLIDITVPRHRRRAVSGARIHETVDPHLMDRRTRFGVPVTGPARTVLDVCWVADDPMIGLAVLDEMRRLRHVEWDELWTCLVLHARRGRNGVALFRQVLQRRWGKRVPGGHFERTAQALLVDAGLPEPEPEHPVVCRGNRYRIDLAYPRELVAIELIGKEAHATDAAFERDPVRRNHLQAAGWIVLEFTWQRLIEDPAGIVTEVRDALALRSCAV